MKLEDLLRLMNPFFWMQLAIKHDETINRIEKLLRDSKAEAHSDAGREKK